MEISLPMKNVGEGRMLLMEKKTKQNRTNLLILVNDCNIVITCIVFSLPSGLGKILLCCVGECRFHSSGWRDTGLILGSKS